MKPWLSFLAALLVLLNSPLVVCGATFGTSPDEEIPPLRPPRPEIPATFWEQHGGKVFAGAAALAVVVAAGVAWLLRTRPSLPVAPEVLARQELAPLHSQPETGQLLSRVSQILRRYVSAALNLAEGELTTTDLDKAMASRKEQVGSELAGNISSFLRSCDERKFAPPAPRPPLGAADQAEKLIESVEARREELRQAASAENRSTSPSPPVPQAQTPPQTS